MRNLRRIKTPDEFRAYAESLGLRLPLDDLVTSGPDSLMAEPVTFGSVTAGNRYAILPMEGWDNTTDGRPTDFTRHRWRRWGESGAKLIFGAEAMAVRPDGRGSPTQLLLLPENVEEIAALRLTLVDAHRERFGSAEDLAVGCQITHSGRVSHPHEMDRSEPRTLYHHPLLDKDYDAESDDAVMTDDEIDGLVEDFVRAAALAQQAGFHFVDVKHCHGYLGHEFLSAVDRPGRYGGSFENRTRFLRDVVAGIRAQAPGLEIAVRFSAVDMVPFVEGPEGRAVPVAYEGRYPYAFGGDGSGVGIDLTEPLAFLDLLGELGITLVGVSAGAEYNSHLMEPYASLPVEPHRPPEDPLVGVSRLIDLTAEFKRLRPGFVYVGAGYSALQQWFPNVAQAAVREHLTDFVGLGRMSYAYPDIVADVLDGRPVETKRCCRSCGFCDVAPAFGLRSGCYALDPFYRAAPDWEQLKLAVKNAGGEAE
jgi:2,4-dienoyl-CoA reductase-like NADH-dependent reductase (Old Yellow Enzyme family)